MKENGPDLTLSALLGHAKQCKPEEERYTPDDPSPVEFKTKQTKQGT